MLGKLAMDADASGSAAESRRADLEMALASVDADGRDGERWVYDVLAEAAEGGASMTVVAAACTGFGRREGYCAHESGVSSTHLEAEREWTVVDEQINASQLAYDSDGER